MEWIKHVIVTYISVVLRRHMTCQSVCQYPAGYILYSGNCILLDCDDEGKKAWAEHSLQGLEHND